MEQKNPAIGRTVSFTLERWKKIDDECDKRTYNGRPYSRSAFLEEVLTFWEEAQAKTKGKRP